MPTALITGILGQDGGYLTEQLQADGWVVHGLASATGPAPAVADAAIHTDELTDAAAMASVLARVEPDVVFNLAGISSVTRSWIDPLATTRVNALGAITLLEAVRRRQDEAGKQIRFVQASSAEIFGDPKVAPQTENTPIRPINPYGATKAFAHQAVGVYRQRGMFAVSLILYNHESPRRPPTFVTGKIAAGVAAIAEGRQQRLTLGNLEARRDWGWAPDFARGMRLAAAAPEPNDYVLATGQTHSVRDFTRAAFDHIGVSDYESYVDIDKGLFRPVDSAELVGDASRARRELGWAPTKDFGEIVAEMVEGFKST